jgi:hypothetical protein
VPPSPPECPKTMLHAGYSVGGVTGLLRKEFRAEAPFSAQATDRELSRMAPSVGFRTLVT